MERKEAADKGCLACSFPFWDKLTDAQQDFLCRFARPVHYDKGAHVHSPTENCVGILLLRSGQLRAYLLGEDGRDVTLYRLFAGDVCILSASCVLDAVTFDVHIDAEEPVEAYCIGAGAFKRVMDENIYVRCYAYQMTAESYSETMWAMQQILFMSADRRLAIFLTDELAKTGGADLRMTHDQIARYMGSAREVVSRMLKYFAQEGLILRPGRAGPAVAGRPDRPGQAPAAKAGPGRDRRPQPETELNPEKQRNQKIRTLLLQEKGSDFSCLVGQRSSVRKLKRNQTRSKKFSSCF